MKYSCYDNAATVRYCTRIIILRLVLYCSYITVSYRTCALP